MIGEREYAHPIGSQREAMAGSYDEQVDNTVPYKVKVFTGARDNLGKVSLHVGQKGVNLPICHIW